MRLSAALSALILLTSIGVAAGAAPGRPPESLLRDARRCEQGVAQRPSAGVGRADWVACMNAYKLVVRLHPRSPVAGEALYRVGRLAEKAAAALNKQEYALDALSSYRQVYDYYPSSPFADKAAFAAGEIYRLRLHDSERAHAAFAVVFERYPGSSLREKAALLMREVQEQLATPASSAEAKPAEEGKRQVVGIRHWSNPNYTRVVIDLSNPARFRKGTLRSPDRIYVDVVDAEVDSALLRRSLQMKDGLLKRVRVGQYRRDLARVVLEVENVRRYKVFSLEDPPRIVVDVKGAQSADLPARSSSRGATERGSQPSSGKLSLTQQLGLSAQRIVIDPGHGGRDPGAIGKTGLEEKEVTLDVAKRLKLLIEARTNKEVLLTRERDIFLPLEERTAIANTHEADLFVSIHVNAAPRRDASGVETYFLNLATTDEARATAARENQTSLRKISDLQSILQELLLTSKLDESRTLAQRVQGAVVRELAQARVPVRNLGVKQAPFYVLIGAQMPSVLVEIAFISNDEEERQLGRPEFRQLMAEAILAGLDDYIRTVQVAARPGR